MWKESVEPWGRLVCAPNPGSWNSIALMDSPQWNLHVLCKYCTPKNVSVQLLIVNGIPTRLNINVGINQCASIITLANHKYQICYFMSIDWPITTALSWMPKSHRRKKLFCIAQLTSPYKFSLIHPAYCHWKPSYKKRSYYSNRWIAAIMEILVAINVGVHCVTLVLAVHCAGNVRCISRHV